MASQINPSSMLAIASTLSALSIIAVGSRFYIRITHKQGLGIDDWLIVPALIMVIGIGITIILGVKEQVVGFADGKTDLSFVNWSITYLEQLFFALYILSLLNTSFSKLSILYFYRRVFYTGFSRRFNIFTQILAVAIVLWTISLFFTFIFECGSDVSIQWGSYANALQQCANLSAINVFWVTSDALFDLILFVIPIPLVLRLKMSTARRLAILAAFAIGALAIVTSIIRLVIIVLIFSVGGDGTDFIGDDLWIAISLFFYWSMFEGGISVIVACLPVLQIWIREISVEAVTRNVLGIFSVQSLSRDAHRSNLPADSVKNTHSSESNLNDPDRSVELDDMSQNSIHDEERQAYS